MSLDMRTASTQIESAIRDQLSFAYGVRIKPTPANTTVVKAFPSAELKGNELFYIASKGFTYKFDRFSTATDDGDTVLIPTDAPTAGRWLKTTSTVQTGYVLETRIHAGEITFDWLLKRAYGRRPSVHIVSDGIVYKGRSQSRGALYWIEANYRIMCASSNLRQGAQAVIGSAFPAEFAADPGVHDMAGDVCASLAGSDLGVTGVAHAEINKSNYLTSDIGGKLFIEEVYVTVFATVHQPDSNLLTIDGLSGLSVQHQLMGGSGTYDVSNLVTSGYYVPTGSGLTQTPVSGTAKIGGTVVSSSPVAHTFGANLDTYRDLNPNGTFTYTAVSHGANPPTITGGSLRVGVTVTDASNVIWDSFIAPTLVNYLEADVVPGAGLGVASILISPSSATSASGTTVKFTATATYTNGATKDISTAVTWTSGTPSVATIDYSGLATLLTPGSSNITCSLDGLASGNSATLTAT